MNIFAIAAAVLAVLLGVHLAPAVTAAVIITATVAACCPVVRAAFFPKVVRVR